MSQTPPINPIAAAGFSSGRSAYARGRPDYPSEAVDWLREDLGLREGGAVLDLGAGTGKFLASLRAAGVTICAVEPVAQMRERLIAANPDITALEGTAERIPLPDASLDAVVCAQAFHWFANSKALAEIRRVLKIGGALGLIWNVRDESVDWVAALTGVIAPYESDAPRFASGAWRTAFPADGFSPLAERCFAYDHVGPPERVIVDRVLSTSFIAALAPAERERVAARVRALIAATPALAGRSEVAHPYQTHAFACRRIN